MKTANKVIDSLKMEVEATRIYNFRIASWHAGDELNKGMVFYAKFFDSKDREISDRLLHFSSSRAFVNYSYITTGSNEAPFITEIGVHAPDKSATAEFGLVNWSFLNKPSGRIEIITHPSIREHCLSDSEFTVVKEINDSWLYHIYVKVINPKEIIGPLAVLIIKYYNEKNALLQPRRSEDLSWSTSLDAYYRYISSDNGATTMSFEHVLYPPEGTTICECQMIEWKHSRVDIAVSGPKEYSLDWNTPNKNKLLQEAAIANSMSPALLTKQADVAESISAKAQHELRYKSFIQSGDLTSAINESLSEHVKNPNEKTLHRLTYTEQLICSLEVDWFPTLNSNNGSNSETDDNKILHLFKVSYPFESTGGSIRNLNIVTSQHKVGLEPFVVTPLNYPRIFSHHEFELDEEIEGVRHIRLDIGSTEMMGLSYICNNLQLNTQMLAGIIRKEKPAIIHAASGYRGYEIAVMAKTLSDHFSIPWIYEVRSFHEHTWTSDSFHAKTASHTEQRMERENSLMLLADHVVTISETMKEAIIERGVDAERITVVPNAVDMDSFAPQKKKAKLIRQLGLRKKTVLGYISNISRREGHDILIKAIPLMVKTNPNIVLLIVGDGREKSNMEKLVSELHIENQVIFTGNIDHRQIKDYYSIIDLFIVPRRRDYASDLVTPLKPYEAMAMKIPLLVSNRPALLEIIGENRGFSFATENVKDLAEVAIGCLENISECGKRTEAAFKWLIKNRTWAMNAVIYKNLYADILQKHRDDNNDD